MIESGIQMQTNKAGMGFEQAAEAKQYMEVAVIVILVNFVFTSSHPREL